jgi:hypothetical protein
LPLNTIDHDAGYDRHGTAFIRSVPAARRR